MTNSQEIDEQEKPLDPAVERVRRKLVRFVAINLGILFLALMAVVGALVYKGLQTPSSKPASPAGEIPVPAGTEVLQGTIVLPQGARINSQASSGSQLTLHVQFPSGEQAIFLYDMAENRIIGRFNITSTQ